MTAIDGYNTGKDLNAAFHSLNSFDDMSLQDQFSNENIHFLLDENNHALNQSPDLSSGDVTVFISAIDMLTKIGEMHLENLSNAEILLSLKVISQANSFCDSIIRNYK